VGCLADSDCGDPALPFCYVDECRAKCKIKDDCPGVADQCDVPTGRCGECFKQADCTDSSRPTCNLATRQCTK
jgi:hypothetical protein